MIVFLGNAGEEFFRFARQPADSAFVADRAIATRASTKVLLRDARVLAHKVSHSSYSRFHAMPDAVSEVVDDGPAPGLPPQIVTKADDLDTIRKTVEDAAAVSGGMWVSYLFLMLYLALTVGAVSHVDLFLENPVKPPFLNGVTLPLQAFFLLAPLVFCVGHIYTLTSFVMLSDKAKRYHDELMRQVAGDDDPDSDKSRQARDIRNKLQRQLPSNIFVQALAGPDDVRAGWLGEILRLIAIVTLVVAPVLLLLLMQVQFLPYHDHVITWTMRLAILTDIVALFFLWPIIMRGRGDRLPLARGLAPAVFGVVVMVFSVAIATFPGEWLEEHLADLKFIPDVDEKGESKPSSIHDFLFSRPIDPLTRRRGLFLSSTLVLPVFDVLEQFRSTSDAKVLGPYRYVFRPRGRDFRGAVFQLSNLSNVDFEGADLRDASFDRAILRDTSMFCADLRDAKLTDAKLYGTWFYGANLGQAHLTNSYGPGALFDGARLQGADFEKGHFEAASFESADLSKTIMKDVDLDAASFAERKDLGASCLTEPRPAKGANLDNTILDGSSLIGATFADARIRGQKHEATSPDQFDGAIFASLSEEQPDRRRDDRARPAFLAKTFRAMVCSGKPDAIFILRGLIATDRLNAAGPEMLTLVEDIASGAPGCPTAAFIDDDTTNIVNLRTTLRAQASKK